MPFCLSKLQIPWSSILSEMQAFEQRTKYFSPEDEGPNFLEKTAMFLEFSYVFFTRSYMSFNMWSSTWYHGKVCNRHGVPLWPFHIFPLQSVKWAHMQKFQYQQGEIIHMYIYKKNIFLFIPYI